MFKGSSTVYAVMYLVGFAIMMVLNLKTYKKYDMTKGRAIILTVLTYICGVAGAIFMGKIFGLVCKSVGLDDSNGVAIFGAVIFTPLLLLFIFLLENLLMKKKHNIKKQMDMLAPGIFIILACAKFGCFCDGCCYGIESSFGMYNPRAEFKAFPVQIFEVLSMIIVLLVAMCIKKSKFFKIGMAFPLTSALYCTTRFCWEFMRYYESDALRHLVFGLTLWQACCVLVITVSIVSLIVLSKKSEAYKS